MTRQEQILEDTKIKAKQFCDAQTKVVVRTSPSTKFPKGAKYEGYIIAVLERLFLFDDTYHGEDKRKRVHIYFSEIAGTADIYEQDGQEKKP
jgi:hypothetical protein